MTDDLLSTMVRCPACHAAVEASLVWAAGDTCPVCRAALHYLETDAGAERTPTPRRRVIPSRVPVARRRRARRAG